MSRVSGTAAAPVLALNGQPITVYLWFPPNLTARFGLLFVRFGVQNPKEPCGRVTCEWSWSRRLPTPRLAPSSGSFRRPWLCGLHPTVGRISDLILFIMLHGFSSLEIRNGSHGQARRPRAMPIHPPPCPGQSYPDFSINTIWRGSFILTNHHLQSYSKHKISLLTTLSSSPSITTIA